MVDQASLHPTLAAFPGLHRKLSPELVESFDSWVNEIRSALVSPPFDQASNPYVRPDKARGSGDGLAPSAGRFKDSRRVNVECSKIDHIRAAMATPFPTQEEVGGRQLPRAAKDAVGTILDIGAPQMTSWRKARQQLHQRAALAMSPITECILRLPGRPPSASKLGNRASGQRDHVAYEL